MGTNNLAVFKGELVLWRLKGACSCLSIVFIFSHTWFRDSGRLAALLHLGGHKDNVEGKGLLLYQAKEKCAVPQSFGPLTFFILFPFWKMVF